jgi:glycosyltransferase involved in cell wall biosynthesis
VRVAVLLEQVLSPVPGGTGRYSRELAAALARTAAPGDEVVGWTAWHADTARAQVPGVGGPRRLPLPRRPLIAAWDRGLGPVPRSADVVHAPTLLVPPRHHGALVATIYDAVPWTHPETLTPRGARWHRAMAARAARDADAIAVLTRAVADELARVPELAGHAFEVVGAGVAPALLEPPPPGSGPSVPAEYLFTLATLEPRKGLDGLVRALALIGPGAPPLLVAGQPGWGGVDLEAAVRGAGLDPSAVRVLGRISDAELAVVLRGATALVMPSLAEGFGLPVAEAMAVGTPVICTDDPSLVEVAGPAARIVARGDVSALATAIVQLVGDPDERARLSALGLQRAPQFSWDEVARRHWAIYRRVTADTTGPR